MCTTAVAETGYRNLPLSMLEESGTNPRRTFEPTKLVELAHSIGAHRLIQPITVRPKGDRFEVVAGAGRFRAAQTAELADVPTRILKLFDEETLRSRSSRTASAKTYIPMRKRRGTEDKQIVGGYFVAPHLLCCTGRVAGQSLTHLCPLRARFSNGGGPRSSIEVRYSAPTRG